MKRMLFSILLVACSKSSSPPPATPSPEPDPVPAPADPAPVSTPEPAPAPEPPPAPKEAKVELAPTAKSKSKVKGTIAFKEVEGGVEVTANVEGLTANKEHAWHIHETGDCSAPDAKSAGEHFNPGGHPHGAPDAEHRHEGDFGNLQADKQGKATKTFVMKGITIGEGATSIVGKGFIIHAKKDDLKSQPSGNAGDRIACGVIAATP
jgi:Cu-Zn family superoxide dismutase